MNKFLLFSISLFFSFNALAQTNPIIHEDFYKGIKNVSAVSITDHLSVMQINIDNDNFSVVAVNDKLQTLWTTPLTGTSIAVAKFHDKIIAVAATQHSSVKGNNNTYKGYLIDPANGKVLVDKVIYTDADDYVQFPEVITAEGTYLKLAVRTSAIERRLHVGIPGIFSLFVDEKSVHQLNQTKALNVISFNEKLEPESSFKPVISNGTFINWTANKRGDLFIGWLNGPNVEVYKYDSGKTQPTAELTADVAFQENEGMIPSLHIIFLPSPSNNDLFYYGVTYLNSDKKSAVGIGKFDFATNKKLFVTEEFYKDHVKALEKATIPFNKKIDNIDLGNQRALELKAITEVDGKLVAFIAGQYTVIGNYGSKDYQRNYLVNGYNTDLSTKFQLLVPSYCAGVQVDFGVATHSDKGKLYFVKNAEKSALYAILNTTTGQWEKMEYLSNKKIDGFSKSAGLMWFGDGFIVSYYDPKGLMQNHGNLTLQLNQY